MKKETINYEEYEKTICLTVFAEKIFDLHSKNFLQSWQNYF